MDQNNVILNATIGLILSTKTLMNHCFRMSQLFETAEINNISFISICYMWVYLCTCMKLNIKFLSVEWGPNHDKYDRNTSYENLLIKHIHQKVVPNGLQIEAELTIGNHNQQFVTKWYELLQSLSLLPND